MQVRKGIFALIIVILSGTIGYLLASRQQESPGSTVVRTYQVAPERAAELKNSLNSLFWTKDGSDSSIAQVFGSGLVLVRAPVGYQQGVQTLIEKMSSQPVEPRRRVRIDYYLVLAQNGKPNASELAPALAPVLASIEKVEGNVRFRVLEHMVTNATSGEDSLAEGAMIKVKSSTSIAQGLLQIKLDLDSWFGRFKTNIDVQSGEFIVIGQNAQRLNDDRTKAFGEGTVYYILRSELQK